MATSAGAVYSFGDAGFYGDAKPGPASHIVGIAPTPQGGGYWLVSSSGGVFCFGDAGFYGSGEGMHSAVVGFAPAADGRGYWLATRTGRAIAFGDARGRGRPAGAGSRARFVGIAAVGSGEGYWFATRSGTTYGSGRAAATATSDLVRDAVATVVGPAVVMPAPPVPASGGAAVRSAGLSFAGEASVRFALAQIGKPYIWGATGPYGYDCSGLALASWRAAGVVLPRTAAEQYYAGAHVPVGQVQPGDLIFWASDPQDPATIYHVAISLGGHRTVQAIETGLNIQVVGSLPRNGLVPLATSP